MNEDIEIEENECQEEEISPFSELITKIEAFFFEIGYIHDYFKDVAKLLNKNELVERKKLNKLTKNLSNQKDEEISLKELKNLIRMMNRLLMINQTFRRNIIVSLISRYDELLNDLLFCLWKDNKFEIKGQKVYSINELKNFTNIEDVFEDYMKQEIDDFMYKCHHDQILYLDSYFKLGLTDKIDKKNDFIELCERRNIIVHNGGRINGKYRSKLSSYGIKIDEDNIKNDLIIINNSYVENAIDTIFEVAFKITQNLVRRLYSEKLYDFEKITNEDIGFPLMIENKWERAKLIYLYLTSLPNKFLENDAWLKMYTINYCICLFHLNEKDEMKKILKGMDWSSASNEFHFAILILNEEYAIAKSEMIKMDGNYPTKDDFLNWPLFKCFRETDEFKEGFKTLFGIEAYDAILEEEIKEINDLKESTEENNL